MIDYIALFDDVLDIAKKYKGSVNGSYIEKGLIDKLKDEINISFDKSWQCKQFLRQIKIFTVCQTDDNQYDLYHNDAFIIRLTISCEA